MHKKKKRENRRNNTCSISSNNRGIAYFGRNNNYVPYGR